MSKNTIIYPAIFEPDDKYILVTVPDIGQSTEGDTILGAVRMAEELIGITLEDKSSFPKPTDIQNIKLNNNQHIAYITVDMDLYRQKYLKTVRKNVTIPAYLNNIAKERKINVSKVLTDALKKEFQVN